MQHCNKKNARKVRLNGSVCQRSKERGCGGSEMAAEEFYHTDAVKTKERGRRNQQLTETRNTFFRKQFPQENCKILGFLESNSSCRPICSNSKHTGMILKKYIGPTQALNSLSA